MDKLADLLVAQVQKTHLAPTIAPRLPQTSLCALDCLECSGSGWVRYDVPLGHALFGKIFPCPNAPLDHPYYDRFGLSAKERLGLSWESIWDESNALEGVEAVQAALSRGSGLVYLWGDNGKAKTLMLKAAVAETLRMEKALGTTGGATYANMASLLDDLRSCYDETNPSKALAERVGYWAGIPVLALDEFDFIRSTEFAQERQFLLLDERYEAAMQGERVVTLMASNGSPAELPRRLYDRIRDGRNRIVHLEGESLRPGLEWQP